MSTCKNLLLDAGCNPSVNDRHATYCPRAFELANHFSEWAGFECNYELLPTRTTRREFVRAYLQALSETAHQLRAAESAPVREDEVDDLMARVDAFRGLPGFYW